ncbi:hypothetical protein Ancab_021049 [Ancistrocladus abbreviatus]
MQFFRTACSRVIDDMLRSLTSSNAYLAVCFGFLAMADNLVKQLKKKLGKKNDDLDIVKAEALLLRSKVDHLKKQFEDERAD